MSLTISPQPLHGINNLAAAITRGAMPALARVFVGTRFGAGPRALRRELGTQRPAHLQIGGQLAAAWQFRHGILKSARLALRIPVPIERMATNHRSFDDQWNREDDD